MVELTGAERAGSVAQERDTRSWTVRFSLHLLAWVMCGLMIFPLIWMLSTAFKGPTEIFTPEPRLLPLQPTLENFPAAFQDKPVWRWSMNSVLFAVLVTGGRLLVAVPAAFAFARLRFPFKNIVFALVIGTMIIPSVVTLIPNYLLIVEIGWINTLQGVIVPTMAGSAFYTFLLRQYMRMIPSEIYDAAAIDGAGPWITLWKIVVPLSAPAIWAVVTLSFLSGWNLYLWPLIVLRDLEAQTLAVGLSTYAADPDTVQLWGPLMVVALLSSIPPLLVYVFAQRHVVSALTSGTKG